MAALTHDDVSGSVLAGRYRLGATLGRGAMGSVYRGVDLKRDRAVAVKVLHASLAADASIVERFTREAEAAAQLDHPNCVQVLAAGTTPDGTRFLVMPLLDGSELRREIAGGMPLRRVVDITLQVLAGLEHAHARGFVHRDVKPENVLLVRDVGGGELAKLVDFGLVKPMTAAPRGRALTAMGKVFGTPWYMAPEQAAGEHIDARADLYAVGMMMFEMLTGMPPFDGDSLAAVLHKHMFAELPALPSWVPAPVAEVVYRLAAKRRDDRPSCAAEAAELLRRAVVRMSSQPTVLPQLSLGDAELRVERPVSMLRASSGGRWLGGLAAVAAALLLAVGLSGLARSNASDTPALEPSAAVASTAAEIWSATAPAPAVTTPAVAIPSTPVVAVADAVDVTTAATPRATGADAEVVEPVVKPSTKPVAKPVARSVSKPSVKPSVPPVAKPAPSGTRKLEASRPPRASTDKLPGARTGGLRSEGGKLHLGPR